MTYTINKTDGTPLTSILDSSIDTKATDLVLIGKNFTGYGEFINENFVKLLENFASATEPPNAIPGQLWYDTGEERIKVYDGNGFRVAAGPVVSATRPLTLAQGDFWIDNEENQLYFNDGVDTVLVGPIWRANQGRSGFEIESILDTFGNLRTITKLWNAGNVLGIFSHHAEFIPSSAVPGFETIKTGLNVSSNFEDFRLHGTATSAESLVDSNGALRPINELFNGNYTFDNENIINISIGSLPLNVSNINTIFLKAGAGGVIRVSTETVLGNQEQFSMEIAPAPVAGSRPTTKLYGNIVVDNVSNSNVFGSSFRLPKYTSAARDSLTYTSENYGEMIYNTSTNKVQAYTSTGWVDLH